ncbi:MAG: zf-HC2 domain-containing protein [Myxococcales bacterium]|nr:zf-HC2 domain-containing protein [Myxococcales bacterium]
MNCRDVQKFIYVYLDEEFDKRESLEFETHVAHCAGCRNLVRFEEHFRVRLRNHLRPTTAPDSLRQKICGALDKSQTISEPSRVAALPHRRLNYRSAAWLGGSLAAGLLFTTFGGWQQVANLPESGEGNVAILGAGIGGGFVSANDSFPIPIEQTTDTAITTHQGNPPLDVQGNEDTVQRYLSSKEFPLRPPLVETFETRLLGARVVQFGASPVILYTYDHGGRRISALQYMAPGSFPVDGKLFNHGQHQGYNLVSFGQGESTVTTLVSELPQKELQRLIPGPISR